jgi:hypothetical protein
MSPAFYERRRFITLSQEPTAEQDSKPNRSSPNLHHIPWRSILMYVRFEVFTAVTVKNAVLWDIKPQFILQRRHIASLLQSPSS